MTTGEIGCGFLAAADGKIASLGEMADCPAQDGFDVCVDAAGGWLLPGLIDAHTHLGLYEDGLGFEGADGNEDTDPATPQMRVIDASTRWSARLRRRARPALPAARSVQGRPTQWAGRLRSSRPAGIGSTAWWSRRRPAIKCALGENPKAVYHEKDDTPVTRMATAAILRETLKKAQEYDARCKKAANDPDEDAPDYEIKYDALLPLLHGEIPAHLHAHRADDIFTALRICREFGIRPVIVHGTEGHLIADDLAQLGVPVLSGPFLTDRSKPELRALTERAPGLLCRAGVQVAITTDHPETPLKYLRRCAAVAAEQGMDEAEALRAITRYPAEILGIADRVGALEPGMDADFVLFSAHPFAFRSDTVLTVCGGEIVYEARAVCPAGTN